MDVQGLLQSLGLACHLPLETPPALLQLLDGMLCEYKLNTAVNRLYRWDGQQIQRLMTHPAVRVLAPTCQALQKGHSAADLRLLMPDAPPELRVEQLRYLAFDRQLLELAQAPWPQVLCERVFWLCDATRSCWPLADKQAKAQVGSVLVTRAPSQKRQIDVCETARLQQRRSDVETWLRAQGLLQPEKTPVVPTASVEPAATAVATGPTATKQEPAAKPKKAKPPSHDDKDKKHKDKKHKDKKHKDKKRKDKKEKKEREKVKKEKTKKEKKQDGKDEKEEMEVEREDVKSPSKRKRAGSATKTEPSDSMDSSVPGDTKEVKPAKKPKAPKAAKEPEPLTLESIFKRPASDDVLDARYALLCEQFDRLLVAHDGAEPFEPAAYRASMRVAAC